MPKSLIVAISLCCFFIGFFTSKAVEDYSKGSGEYFYSESLDHPERIIYHSTSKCPAIKNGVTIGQFFENPIWRESNSSFCTKCMDDSLMIKCSKWLDSRQ